MRYLTLILSITAIGQTLPQSPPLAAMSESVYQVSYLDNLNVGDSFIHISNLGAVSGYDPAGRMCANIYVFDPNEEPVSCCACPVTPNGLLVLSARTSLIARPLTAAVPTSIVVKILFTSGSLCDAGTNGSPARGGLAWSTTLHANTSYTPATYEATQTPFEHSELSPSEAEKLVNICRFIETYSAVSFPRCSGC